MASARIHLMNAEEWLDAARRFKSSPQEAAACAYVADIEMKMSQAMRETYNVGSSLDYSATPET